jgi:hypothetical protein
MTDKRRKYTCPICEAEVRRIGKHGNQKHDVSLRPLPDGSVAR